MYKYCYYIYNSNYDKLEQQIKENKVEYYLSVKLTLLHDKLYFNLSCSKYRMGKVYKSKNKTGSTVFFLWLIICTYYYIFVHNRHV